MGGNETVIAMIIRQMILVETNTTGNNAIIYCAEDTALTLPVLSTKKVRKCNAKIIQQFSVGISKIIALGKYLRNNHSKK